MGTKQSRVYVSNSREADIKQSLAAVQAVNKDRKASNVAAMSATLQPVKKKKLTAGRVHTLPRTNKRRPQVSAQTFTTQDKLKADTPSSAVREA